MTPEQFCYWLQGRAELLPDQPPTADEWKMICEHLALTFKKVTPPPLARNPNLEEMQRALRPLQPLPDYLRDLERAFPPPPDMSPPRFIC